ncbi:MAG TPA: hypothetical protein VJA21_30470 [Verrucomicrobiae bacterium]
MKLRNLVVGLILAVGLAGIAGCGKKLPEGNSIAPLEVEGVKVDLPKLQASVDAGGNADLQSGVRGVVMAFRYRQYDKALMEMEKVTTNPALTEEQKKMASDVFEQVKQIAAKAPPAPQ